MHAFYRCSRCPWPPEEGPVETKQSLAEFACLERAFEKQGLVSTGDAEQASSAPKIELDEAAMLAPAFRFVSTGQFVIDYGRVPLRPAEKAFHLTCTGDFTASTLTSVQIDGRLYKPQNGEQWTF